MKKHLTYTLLILGCANQLAFAQNDKPMDQQEKLGNQMEGASMQASSKNDAMGMMDHSHLPITVPTDALKPKLSLSIEKDAMSGYNLTLNHKNYQFVMPPLNATMMELMKPYVDEKTNTVEGHAHLYVNGTKIQRVYGKYLHLPESLFTQGTNSISITLNNNGHMTWNVDEKQIVSTIYVNHSKDDYFMYQFDSFPIE